MFVNVICVDYHGCTIALGCSERNIFEESFHDRMQTPRAYVLCCLVNVPGEFGNSVQTVVREFHVDVFGGQQCLILLGERGLGLNEDTFEIFGC